VTDRQRDGCTDILVESAALNYLVRTKRTESWLSLTHQANNPAVGQHKNIKGQRIRGVSLVGEEKVYGGKGFTKELSLKVRMKNE